MGPEYTLSVSSQRGYLEQSSDLGNSLILVAPLLVLYELGLLAFNFSGMNGVDFITVLVVRQFGVRGLVIANMAILAAIAFAAHSRQKERRFDPSIAPLVVIESTVYAFLLGFIIIAILQKLKFNPAMQTAGGDASSVLHAVVVSLGAGVNEELFFRALLFNGIVLLLSHGEKQPSPVPTIIALVVSSVLFSLAHYLGPEPFHVYSFVYRILAGAIFCGIYLGRGLAVAVYTHAIYDIIVLVLSGRA